MTTPIPTASGVTVSPTTIRTAAIPLQDSEILGLLNGNLKVDPEGPQVPVDATFYLLCEQSVEDGIARQVEIVEGKPQPVKGIILAICSPSLEEVKEGDVMPALNVRFVSA